MRFNLSLLLCLSTISVGVLIVWVEGTDIIILKSADENDNPNLSIDQPAGSQPENTTTKRVFGSQMGGLCSSAELSIRHRHRRHHHTQNSSCSCRRILCPVCANDNQSYANLCYLNCQKLIHPDLELAYNGRCKTNTVKSSL